MTPGSRTCELQVFAGARGPEPKATSATIKLAVSHGEEITSLISGEDRIRTCGPGFPSHRFSKPALSTTQPPLRSPASPPAARPRHRILGHRPGDARSAEGAKNVPPATPNQESNDRWPPLARSASLGDWAPPWRRHGVRFAWRNTRASALRAPSRFPPAPAPSDSAKPQAASPGWRCGRGFPRRRGSGPAPPEWRRTIRLQRIVSRRMRS